MYFVDSHTHLHDRRIFQKTPEIINRAIAAGLIYMATCATMEDNFEHTRQLSHTHPELIPHFGIHPWFVDSLTKGWKKTLAAYLESVPSGVGEIGLDFIDKKVNRDRQIEVFEYQLSLAVDLGRPVNIHNRKAWDSMIHVLKRFGSLRVPGLIHSYSGSADMVPLFEKYNLYISFSGSVTNPKNLKVLKSLKAVQDNRFVLETDTPDIQPYINGKQLTTLNEPSNVPEIAKIAAQRLGIDENWFAEQALTNSLALFNPVLSKIKSNNKDYNNG